MNGDWCPFETVRPIIDNGWLEDIEGPSTSDWGTFIKYRATHTGERIIKG